MIAAALLAIAIAMQRSLRRLAEAGAAVGDAAPAPSAVEGAPSEP